jgi:hypothetical protein
MILGFVYLCVVKGNPDAWILVMTQVDRGELNWEQVVERIEQELIEDEH